MKKILAFSLIISVSAVNAGWLTNKIKSAATAVKNTAKRVHNSSAATALRNKVKSGAKQAYGYVTNKVSESYGLPYQIVNTVKKLKKDTQTIEINCGTTTATANLIALCEECEAKPIKVMRSISDISNCIGEMEKLKDKNGVSVIPKESIDILLGYGRDLKNLVDKYSAPYKENIRAMLNGVTAIQSAHASTEEATQIVTLSAELAEIMNGCLKDMENLEPNMSRVATLINQLQEQGIDVTILTTCYMNLQNLIQSMNTLTKFKATEDNLVKTAETTVTNLEQTASRSATNLVNSANSAVLQSTELVNQGIQSSTEKLAEGIDSAMDYTQDAANKSAEYLNDSANKLNQGLENLSEKVNDSSNNFNDQVNNGIENI